jgi:hypothetical protein
MIRAVLCGSLVLLAAWPAGGQTTQQAASITPAGPTTLQGFSVVLVLGSVSDSNEPFAPDVPRGATRALKDMADFLPFRSYRLLDSAWILNTGAGRVTNRVRGVENRTYEVSLDSAASGAARIGVKFALRDTSVTIAAAADSQRAKDAPELAETAKLTEDLVGLETEVAALQQKVDVTHPDAVRKRLEIEEKKRRLELLKVRQKRGKTVDGLIGSRIIDTSFTMDVGETVVVGTSRLQGDAALIVLLTAVPRATK